MKKGVLRNFTEFTGKHLCQSLFFNKEETLAQMLSCESCLISKNTQGSTLRSANRDLQIEFVFSWITLSSFCEIRKSKLLLLLEFLSSVKPQSFCLHFKLDKSLISYSKKLNCTLFSCIWIAFWPQTPNEGLKLSPLPCNCWNFSLNLRGSLLKN